MEVLTLTGALFSVGYTFELFYRVARVIQQGQGPRSENLWIGFLVEKARYADWKKRMGVETRKDAERFLSKLTPDARASLADILALMGVETRKDAERFLSKLAPDARASLTDILAPMERYTKEIEDMNIKYGIHSYDSVVPPLKATRMARRANFAIDGIKNLTELLKIVITCNNRLLQLAPPAPEYPYHNLATDHIIPDEDASSSFQVPRFQTSTLPSLIRGEPKDQGTPQPTSDTAQSSSECCPIMKLLLSNCASTIRSIVSYNVEHKEVLGHAVEQLGLWATGLFSGRITLDQVLHGKSEPNKLFREQIIGMLVDISIYLECITSTISTAENSTVMLSSRRIFSLPDITAMGIAEVPEYDVTDSQSVQEVRKFCVLEVDYLIECLGLMLPTIRMMFEIELSMSKQNPALDEREMVLLNEVPEVASNGSNEPMSELLKIDLELIGAMQESLRNSGYAKYLGAKNPVTDPKRLQNHLNEERKQVAYWTSKLNMASFKHGKADETDSAVLVSLARIARAFQAGYKPAQTRQPVDVKSIDSLLQKHLPKDLADSMSPEFFGVEDDDPELALKALRLSRVELQRLCASKNPDWSYQKDFTLTPSASIPGGEISLG